jgi:hypothetical protein
MTGDFCTRTARRIRRLGYPPIRAAWLAKACLLLMLSLCGALCMALGKRRAGLMEGPDGASGFVVRFSCSRAAGTSLAACTTVFSSGHPPLVPAIQRPLPAF